MNITIALLTWFIPIAVNVYLDRNGAKRNYLQVNMIRGIVLILHAVFFFNLQGGYFRSEDIIRNTPIIIYYFTSYWLFFEIGLNIVRNRASIWYYDTKELDSGWIDGFFAKYPSLHKPAKTLAAVLLLLSIIFIYINN